MYNGSGLRFVPVFLSSILNVLKKMACEVAGVGAADQFTAATT